MKKLGITFSLLAAALVLHAASTCQTRVDSHQNATTLERVDYCLTPEKPAPQPAGPEVIYTNITDKTPEPQPKEKTTPLKQKYYNEDNIEISHGYVGSAYFPVLKNDIPTQRELQEQQAQTEAQDKQAQKPAREMKNKKDKTKKPAKQTTAKRTEKPARTVVTVETETTTEVQEVAPENELQTAMDNLAAEPVPAEEENPFSLD